MTVEITPIHGIGDIGPGDDLAEIIVSALKAAGFSLRDGDVLVVTHKAVSKAENAIVRFDDDEDVRRRIVADGPRDEVLKALSSQRAADEPRPTQAADTGATLRGPAAAGARA